MLVSGIDNAKLKSWVILFSPLLRTLHLLGPKLPFNISRTYSTLPLQTCWNCLHFLSATTFLSIFLLCLLIWLILTRLSMRCFLVPPLPRPDSMVSIFIFIGLDGTSLALLIKAVCSFFTKNYLPRGVKATALVLIPKHKHASNISDFRPIALCNVLYKCIAKILANRLSLVMPYIVKPNQSGFVKHRISSDNILLAKEILAHCNKNCTKIFCAKLDIRKAFDSVAREFLIARLHQIGFPTQFMNWIKSCIFDVNFSVILNGGLEGYFPSSAGLRQGCPLSPLLFCLVMDAFSSLLDASGFSFSLEGFSITHLLYADDVLIFGEASFDNCHVLNEVLNKFALASGLHINLDKSSIMFPKCLRNSTAICDAVAIHNVCESINYLGIPLSFKVLKIADFMPLIDSLSKKMSGWRAKLLSIAGRLQFFKFTMINSIAYWIRGSIMPKSILKFIKRISSKFLLFGEMDGCKKIHMLSWDKICKPKACGGLGLPSLNALQHAFNCSVITRMYNSNSLFANWLINRYKSPWRPYNFSDSKFWKSICSTAQAAKPFFIFRITSSSPIMLHWDHWCHNCPLSDVPDGLSFLNLMNTELKLREFIVRNNWVLPNSIPLHLQNYISTNCIYDNSLPCLCWYNNSPGSFSEYIKSYYIQEVNVAWANHIWHKNSVLRFSVCSWFAIMGGLKTADELLKRNIIVPSTCGLCFNAPETAAHLFFECSYSFAIITHIMPAAHGFLLKPNVMQLLDWIETTYSMNSGEKSFYLLAACCSIYFIWKERNDRRFGTSSHSFVTTAFVIKKAVLEKVYKWQNASILLELL
ncbi:hypothetical protein KFK09_006467 [Dendrobium nobile]|uniref:Reverse transcriptase domain-containing protein n=1 Tax=Dendrobium nobile TaxID=94219 RepID=A0A8T3BPP2_DENNO|nr:hypothetical protein KFK09_006467 [Dendrobium nobile]